MNPATTFKELSLPAPLSETLEKMGFLVPTPIQAACIPRVLAGKDILGTAQTGTGKTAAFGVPLLSLLYPTPGKQALILSPTRELAAQIHRVLREMGKDLKLRGVLLVGGESFYRQKHEMREEADYFVATPGRLIDHLSTGLKLSRVNFLVLDEADRMLDMGFAPQLKEILPNLPKERQTLLFSATIPQEILRLAHSYLKNPERVAVGTQSQPISAVTQENHETIQEQKFDLLLKHLSERKGRILIFTRTQFRTDNLYHLLKRKGHTAVSLHGGRTQGQRKEALLKFRRGSHRVLVATDLAGRGIDVEDIEVVINYDLPGNRADYIHRIGRTARNGKTGLALNYLTPQDRHGQGIVNEQRGARPVASRPNAPSFPPRKQKGFARGHETSEGRSARPHPSRPPFGKRPRFPFGVKGGPRPQPPFGKPSRQPDRLAARSGFKIADSRGGFKSNSRPGSRSRRPQHSTPGPFKRVHRKPTKNDFNPALMPRPDEVWE